MFDSIVLAAAERAAFVEGAAARLLSHLDRLFRFVYEPQLADAERGVGLGLRVPVVDGRVGRDDFDDKVG